MKDSVPFFTITDIKNAIHHFMCQYNVTSIAYVATWDNDEMTILVYHYTRDVLKTRNNFDDFINDIKKCGTYILRNNMVNSITVESTDGSRENLEIYLS